VTTYSAEEHDMAAADNTQDPDLAALDRDLSVIVRAEVEALIALLVRKGVFSQEEFDEDMERVARLLIPGYRTVQTT
jgi:hypothetical protein